MAITPHSRYAVPDSLPDEGTVHICGFSSDWLPILLGLLEPLKNPAIWIDPPDDISAQVDTFIDLIMTDLD